MPYLLCAKVEASTDYQKLNDSVGKTRGELQMVVFTSGSSASLWQQINDAIKVAFFYELIMGAFWWNLLLLCRLIKMLPWISLESLNIVSIWK